MPKLPKEETFESMAASLATIAAEKNDLFFENYKAIGELAASGLASKKFQIGDEIPVTFTDTNGNSKQYDTPFVVNHFCDETDQLGKNIHGMWAMSRYANLHPVPFSGYRAFYAAPDGLAAGTYHVAFGGDWGKNVHNGDTYQFTLTKAVPSGGRLGGFHGAPDQNPSAYRVYSYAADGETLLETVTATAGNAGTDLGTMKPNTRTGNLNCFQECAYGLNDWSKSALRQRLNSDKPAGQWWKPQDQWDIAPDQAATVDGFLRCLPKEFVDILVPVKVITFGNACSEGSEAKVTYDKVIIPSKTNMFLTEQVTEGVSFDYWKLVNGTSTRWPDYKDTLALKQYAIENHVSSQRVRLRSASRGYADYAWGVYPSGYVYSNYAIYASRCEPLVFISQSNNLASEASA